MCCKEEKDYGPRPPDNQVTMAHGIPDIAKWTFCVMQQNHRKKYHLYDCDCKEKEKMEGSIHGNNCV